jgi:DNA-directed RNA polymerase subunit alpha
MTILKESWMNLTKPAFINLKEGSDDLCHSVIVFEPFERGFGNTLGNSLRRVLLSSITGFAVVGVKIEGVLHEYSAIHGIKEDVLEIIMNLKSLAISKDNSESIVLKLHSDKIGPVYAGSISSPAGVEILNKDLLICNVESGGKIDMNIYIQSGNGYVMAENIVKEDMPIGTIFIDALFNPVKTVSYRVENARVGNATDYDKLIIEISTNGAISPRNALAVAAKILQTQFQFFINLDVENIDFSKEKKDSIEPEFNRNLLKTIEELELSVRSYNCLRNENIVYVGDLIIRTEAEMLKTANFGRKSLNELKENLKSMNLSFGMKMQNWPPKNIEDLVKYKNKEF